MIKKGTFFLWFAILALFSSCDLLNCTQADVSCLRIEIYNADGGKVMLPDTLTVTAYGTDSVLINKDINTTEILLPLSYHAPVDTFVIRYYGHYYSILDTLCVQKTNDLYFESPDCPTVMMHTILGVSCTDEFIGSVEVVSEKVNFEEAVHLKLFVQEQ